MTGERTGDDELRELETWTGGMASVLFTVRQHAEAGRNDDARALLTNKVFPSLAYLAGRLARLWREAGPRDSRERMTALAETFPELQGRPGVRPFDAGELDAWAARGEAGSGALHAARFVLSVWFPSHAWTSGPFDLQRALGSWDADHRAAFLVWASDPWNP